MSCPNKDRERKELGKEIEAIVQPSILYSSWGKYTTAKTEALTKLFEEKLQEKLAEVLDK